MDVKYCEYTLTPLKRANRLASLERKKAVYLSFQSEGVTCFADYFPHEPLGDQSVEAFLEGFHLQTTVYQRKVLELLKRDREYQSSPVKTFHNHQLWSEGDPVLASVVKTKIFRGSDRHFLLPLSQGKRVRLDPNGGLSRDEVISLWESIPEEQRSLVDYMEDPMEDTDWEGLPFPLARDFIDGSPFHAQVYKPNSEFTPQGTLPIIYSTYMGSDLGAWHACAEMMKSNSTQVHGLITPGIYQEQRPLFLGDYQSGFTVDLRERQNIYQDLAQRSWRHLCSI